MCVFPKSEPPNRIRTVCGADGGTIGNHTFFILLLEIFGEVLYNFSVDFYLIFNLHFFNRCVIHVVVYYNYGVIFCNTKGC